jgi:hypothetical protein
MSAFRLRFSLTAKRNYGEVATTGSLPYKDRITKKGSVSERRKIDSFLLYHGGSRSVDKMNGNGSTTVGKSSTSIADHGCSVNENQPLAPRNKGNGNCNSAESGIDKVQDQVW